MHSWIFAASSTMSLMWIGIQRAYMVCGLEQRTTHKSHRILGCKAFYPSYIRKRVILGVHSVSAFGHWVQTGHNQWRRTSVWVRAISQPDLLAYFPSSVDTCPPYAKPLTYPLQLLVYSVDLLIGAKDWSMAGVDEIDIFSDFFHCMFQKGEGSLIRK